jgi:murein DD-endopeptidase MepM/ murein hydrolase activator NlpD
MALVAIALALILAATGGPFSGTPNGLDPTALDPNRPQYVPPVDAPIVERFRPPPCTWCPGNRGIDYDTTAGSWVRASAAGLVTFAGSIGGDRFVVVAHPDGLRTTYAFLAGIKVAAGDRVAQRQVVGTAGDRLHFGVRRGATYLDPELLFVAERWVARLVPLRSSAGAWGERPAGG